MSDPLAEAEPGLRASAGLRRQCLFAVTILLVEDSRSASEAIRLFAAESGARVRRADSLHAASRHLAIYRPNVVMVDLGLPDGDGLATVRPERIHFGAPADDEHGVTGLVDAVHYLGATTRYRVHTAEGTDVTVEVANTSHAPSIAVGDTVQLAWHDADRRRVGPPLADAVATD